MGNKRNRAREKNRATGREGECKLKEDLFTTNDFPHLSFVWAEIRLSVRRSSIWVDANRLGFNLQAAYISGCYRGDYTHTDTYKRVQYMFRDRYSLKQMCGFVYLLLIYFLLIERKGLDTQNVARGAIFLPHSLWSLCLLIALHTVRLMYPLSTRAIQ